MQGLGCLEEGVIKTEKIEIKNKALQDENDIFRKISRLPSQK